MKKLALLALVLLSFTNVFAMSEGTTSCDDSVQISAYQTTDTGKVDPQTRSEIQAEGTTGR